MFILDILKDYPKNIPINILSVYNSKYIEWIYNNIINNSENFLYILNQTLLKKDIFKNNQIIYIKEDQIYNHINNVLFYYIIINDNLLNNQINNLINIYNLLEDDGKIILIKSKKSKKLKNQLKLFISIYKMNIDLKETKEYYIIHKIKNKEDINIPIYVYKIIEVFSLPLLKKLKIILNKNQVKNINWKFMLNNQYSKGNSIFGYNYLIEKYENFIYIVKELKKYNKEHFISEGIYRKNTELLSYLGKKQKNINKIKKYLNLKTDFRMHLKMKKLFQDSYILNNELKNKSMFLLTNVIKKATSTDFFKSKKIKKIKNPIVSEKDGFKNSNLFNFINVNQYVQKNINQKQDLIFILLGRYIRENNLVNSYIYYNGILLVNILYLILLLQKEGGELYLILPPLVSTVQVQILQIFTHYYKNVSLKIYQTYEHDYSSVCIHAYDFKGISKDDYNIFEETYLLFFKENIEKHVEKIFEGKKLPDLHLESIYTNPISKNLIKKVYDFNNQFYTKFIKGVQNKLDLDNFLHQKNTTKKQKEFVENEIFKIQYQQFIKTYKEIKDS